VLLALTVELENCDSLIQPTAYGQGIDGLDLIKLQIEGNKKCFFYEKSK
jgi:hypothetical protein